MHGPSREAGDRTVHVAARPRAVGGVVLRDASMRLRRLLTMSVPELACRGRQETSKWLERLAGTGETIGQPRAIFLQIGWVPSQAGFDSRVQAGDLGKAVGILLEEFKREGGNRFLEGIRRDGTRGLLARQ